MIEKAPEAHPAALDIIPEPDRYFPPKPPASHGTVLEPPRAPAARPLVDGTEAETETQSIVVPITFPSRGKSGEIVIRIVLTSQDS